MNQQQYLDKFKAITEEMINLTAIKNSDYASEANPFLNFEFVERAGLTSTEVGILTRMGDKYQRLCNLTKKDPSVTTESFKDTCLDLAVYAIILAIYRG
jgi:hypothetical protein